MDNWGRESFSDSHGQLTYNRESCDFLSCSPLENIAAFSTSLHKMCSNQLITAMFLSYLILFHMNRI